MTRQALEDPLERFMIPRIRSLINDSQNLDKNHEMSILFYHGSSDVRVELTSVHKWIFKLSSNCVESARKSPCVTDQDVERRVDQAIATFRSEREQIASLLSTNQCIRLTLIFKDRRIVGYRHEFSSKVESP